MTEHADLEYCVLNCLDRADGPVGCGGLCDWLRQNGQEISEATAGRLLREMDYQDLTERAGYKGRTLTEKGHARLAELRHERAVARSSTDLMQALITEDTAAVIDVLVARRAIERETARLAAMLATEQDVQALDAILERYDLATQAHAIAESDFIFHVRLAEISGNRVLQATTRLIHSQAHASMIPAQVHRRMKPNLSRQHREILAAIRAHDPERAESAMVAHLEGVIDAVRRYGREPVPADRQA